MRVFVSGASGWIGSAVVPELLAVGHTVAGLARSDASAAAVEAAGATTVRGDVTDLDVLRSAAAASDAVVHLAFRHDIAFSGGFADAVASDQAAITALGEGLPDGGALTIAGGILGLASGGPATECDVPAATSMAAGRQASATAVLALAPRLRTSVVRLSPTVHGDGDAGFVPTLVDIARRRGVSGYPGDGSARWTAVAREDAARLFRLAIEVAPAGSVLHGVADEGIPLREIAEVIGRHLDVPVESVPRERVDEHFGFLGGFLGLDSPATNAITRELTGWVPTGPGLLEDLEKGHYFDPRKGSKY
ncbi:NAD-dependent epimerase/dehydratase family protein [Actinomycetospora soli]|uniref:NAD-dependent epimerase/dehydratase family protein n=1 Tax=Actinomycetospora soli TaxID=2893887 RepID=UPI001E3FEEC8|nr:NAD-dependent epimerase/dehydratase family protein [Actinomycetospora soli]MCD2189890.1 NAD-dependent epimerase/dehydratase family protein [Actinomycetospora soli]